MQWVQIAPWPWDSEYATFIFRNKSKWSLALNNLVGGTSSFSYCFRVLSSSALWSWKVPGACAIQGRNGEGTLVFTLTCLLKKSSLLKPLHPQRKVTPLTWDWVRVSDIHCTPPKPPSSEMGSSTLSGVVPPPGVTLKVGPGSIKLIVGQLLL